MLLAVAVAFSAVAQNVFPKYLTKVKSKGEQLALTD
jgi:hypothetical protein